MTHQDGEEPSFARENHRERRRGIRKFHAFVSRVRYGCGVGSLCSAGQSGRIHAGKIVTIVVGYAAGASGYDANARFIARHLRRFLPGAPTIIVRNMVGAGGLVAANHVANLAPKDGTTLAVVARGMGIEPCLAASMFATIR